MREPDGTIRKRRRSLNEPGHVHELTFTCYRGLPLLSRDRTCEWFIKALDQARTKHNLELWAYVIMPEHVHVLLLPAAADYSIAAILQSIKQPVARRAVEFLKKQQSPWLEKLCLTKRDGRVTHRFWQPGGGYDRNITSAAIAWRSVEYLHNNPVRRKLAEHPTDWPWSSARWYAGVDGVVLPMDGPPPDR